MKTLVLPCALEDPEKQPELKGRLIGTRKKSFARQVSSSDLAQVHIAHLAHGNLKYQIFSKDFSDTFSLSLQSNFHKTSLFSSLLTIVSNYDLLSRTDILEINIWCRTSTGYSPATAYSPECLRDCLHEYCRI